MGMNMRNKLYTVSISTCTFVVIFALMQILAAGTIFAQDDMRTEALGRLEHQPSKAYGPNWVIPTVYNDNSQKNAANNVAFYNDIENRKPEPVAVELKGPKGGGEGGEKKDARENTPDNFEYIEEPEETPDGIIDFMNERNIHVGHGLVNMYFVYGQYYLIWKEINSENPNTKKIMLKVFDVKGEAKNGAEHILTNIGSDVNFKNCILSNGDIAIMWYSPQEGYGRMMVFSPDGIEIESRRKEFSIGISEIESRRNGFAIGIREIGLIRETGGDGTGDYAFDRMTGRGDLNLISTIVLVNKEDLYSNTSGLAKYDLNNDGKIDNIDRSMYDLYFKREALVRYDEEYMKEYNKNYKEYLIGTGNYESRMDLDNDGVIDKADSFMAGLNNNVYYDSIPSQSMTGNALAGAAKDSFSHNRYEDWLQSKYGDIAEKYGMQSPSLKSAEPDLKHRDDGLSKSDGTQSFGIRDIGTAADYKKLQDGFRQALSSYKPIESFINSIKPVDSLEETLKELENKESRTEVEDQILNAIQEVIKNSDYIDDETMREFQQAVYVVRAASEMAGLMEEGDFNAIAEAFSSVADDQEKMYAKYIKDTETAYVEIEAVLGLNVEDAKLPERYITLAKLALEAKRKMLVDMSLKNINEKDPGELTDNEIRALDIYNKSIKPLQKEYRVQLSTVLEKFMFNIRKTLVNSEPASMLREDGQFKAIFKLDTKPE